MSSISLARGPLTPIVSRRFARIEKRGVLFAIVDISAANRDLTFLAAICFEGRVITPKVQLSSCTLMYVAFIVHAFQEI